MKYRLLLLFILCFGSHISVAQYETVLYDYARNWFGENQALPAEGHWMLTGALPEDVNMVELEIYNPRNSGQQFLYRSDYQRPQGVSATQFTIPVNYKLRGNSAYNLRMLYYKDATDEDVARLSESVSQALTAYLNQSVVAGRRNVELAKHPRLMRQELDQIVADGLGMYRHRVGIAWTGFSDIVYDKLERMDDLRLRNARFNILAKADDDARATRVTFFQNNMDELALLLEREVNNYLSGDFYVLREARNVHNYKSEPTRWTLPVNVGYAALYDNVASDGFNVEGSPYVGISIPLGNPNFSGNFWSNSSISVGAMLQNVSFADDRTYSGPLIDRPIYLAYGYKTAYFLRLNAGVAVMQEQGSSAVHISPFVGVAIELNFWMGLNR